MPTDIDILVIGGGPAGSAIATLLARAGWSVRLCEREAFPRDHVGESLLPASLPILDRLGVLPTVEAEGFTKKLGATMVWGADPAPWTWYFRETNRTHPYSYQVWRPRFDQILLDNARATGVDVRERHRVLACDVAVDLPECIVATPGGEERWSARFVVDASGQTGLLGRALGLRRHDDYFRNLAVYAYWEGANHLAPPDDGNIFIESYPDGWLWCIPLAGGRTSVGAVVDSARGQESIAARGATAFLDAQIAAAPHAARLLSAGRRVTEPEIVRDWSYVSTRLAGPNYLLVGDAACFVDPLFSSGVHLALSSAMLGAAYVNSALRDPGIAAPAADVYAQLYMQQYGHFRELARLFYASNRTIDSYFWEARRILQDDGVTPREAFIRAVAGQPPQGYERVVLDRGDAPPDFAAGVHALEAGRAARHAWWERALAGDLRASPAYTATPRLIDGAHIERRPVLEEDAFVWGHVLVTPARPEGAPLSPLVAQLLELLDGATPLRDVLADLAARNPGVDTAQLLSSAVGALRILDIDGALAGLAAAAGEGGTPAR